MTDDAELELIERFLGSARVRGTGVETSMFMWLLAPPFEIDGHEPLRWTEAEITDFMDQFWASTPTDRDEDERVVASLIVGLEFLGDAGAFALGSDPAERLVAAVRASSRPEGISVVRTPGMADAIVQAMVADGVEIGDDEQMQAWIEQFNARPEAERRKIVPPTPGEAVGMQELRLPVRAAPDVERVREVAASAKVLWRMDRLADYFAEARPLTAKGNLKVADAKALVELLDTGDEIDPVFGAKVDTTRSIENLPRLDFIVEWATRVGALRVVRGRIVANQAWHRRRQAEPGAALDALVDGFMEIGPLVGQSRWTYSAFVEEQEFAEDGLPVWLADMYASGARVAFDGLAALLADVMWEHLPRRLTSSRDRCDRMGQSYLQKMMSVLDDAAVIAWGESREVVGEYGERRRMGGYLELTEYGVAYLQRWLPRLGYTVPIASPFEMPANAPVDEVVAGLHAQLEGGGPALMCEALATLGNHDRQRELIGAMWRLHDTRVAPVLDAIGRHHPDKIVAKAARKSALQHRSWLANG